MKGTLPEAEMMGLIGVASDLQDQAQHWDGETVGINVGGGGTAHCAPSL